MVAAPLSTHGHSSAQLCSLSQPPALQQLGLIALPSKGEWITPLRHTSDFPEGLILQGTAL